MSKTMAIVGTDAIAEAMRQIDPEVVAAYPITPQTAIVEKFSEYVADGLVNTQMVKVESEHSAMSACVGAAAAGGRVMTATSSQGLALMWEILYVASGLRLPIVLVNVNRTLSAPINIHCDHSDSMGARDASWIQIYSENAQEAYHNVLQAVRIAEHPEVRLPVMVNLDGFIISHAVDRIDILDDAPVREFIGEYSPAYPLLDVANPVSVGMFDGLYGYFFEAKRAQEASMEKAMYVIQQVGEEFGQRFGRPYGLWEEYGLEDARACVVALNSACGTIRTVIEAMRQEGKKIGLLKLRVFRPWPGQELVRVLQHFPVVAVFDRALAFKGGHGGPLYTEVAASLYEAEKRPLLANYVYGLGGRDLSVSMVRQALEEIWQAAEAGRVASRVNYLGLRE
ncbi:MAG: pyruvate ferredoxin oxidoreductase [Clostridia bacterium]|nr:MAG: pyruvate ferredoxin oxidoreductase [Clostridia bacterium]